jgi:hypothetical protein
MGSSCIQKNYLIIGGDLNLTMSRKDISCSYSREDVLAIFFIKKFERVGLLDVEPIALMSTR